MKDKKRIILYVMLLLIYIMIVLFMLLLHDKKEVRFFVKRAEYHPQEIDIIDSVKTNDCVIDQENCIQITGDDPFIVYDVPPVWVWDVSLDITDDYAGFYKIYYGLDYIFSEKNIGKADGGNGEFIIGDYINSIRIDFEQSSLGDVYRIRDDGRLYLNSREQTNIVNVLIKEMAYGLVFFILAGAYMLSRIIRKRYQNLLSIYCCSIFVNYIWIIAAVNNPEVSIKIWIFIMNCIGLIFVGNIKGIEEKE